MVGWVYTVNVWGCLRSISVNDFFSDNFLVLVALHWGKHQLNCLEVFDHFDHFIWLALKCLEIL